MIPTSPPRDVGAGPRAATPRTFRASRAREQEQAEHERHEEQRVLRGDRVAHRKPGEREQHRARRPVALAQHEPEGREAEERREHVREQQRRERQHERAEPEDHRGGGAVAGLEALCHPPHEQQQEQPGQHVAPQPDQVDHLVVAALRLRFACAQASALTRFSVS